MRRAITHITESGDGVHAGNAAEFSPDTEIAFGAQAEATEVAEAV
jgi:hypothetical protein